MFKKLRKKKILSFLKNSEELSDSIEYSKGNFPLKFLFSSTALLSLISTYAHKCVCTQVYGVCTHLAHPY